MQIWKQICKSGRRYSNLWESPDFHIRSHNCVFASNIFRTSSKYINLEANMQIWKQICKSGSKYANLEANMQIVYQICKSGGTTRFEYLLPYFHICYQSYMFAPRFAYMLPDFNMCLQDFQTL